jgi:hypothetical protein
LTIGQTKSKKPSLDFVADMPHLQTMWVEGQSKGFEVIANLWELRTLRMRVCKQRTFGFLSNHPALERLEVLYSSVRDLQPLATVPLLSRMWLCRFRGLANDDLVPLATKSLGMLSLTISRGSPPSISSANPT